MILPRNIMNLYQERKNDIALNLPLLADADKKVSKLYDMIHPSANDSFTVRSVFVIDPASTGRNFVEILRCIDSLQLTDQYKVATPVNWKSGEDVIIVPSLQDKAEMDRLFPKGYKVVKPYLRITPQPNK